MNTFFAIVFNSSKVLTTSSLPPPGSCLSRLFLNFFLRGGSFFSTRALSPMISILLSFGAGMCNYAGASCRRARATPFCFSFSSIFTRRVLLYLLLAYDRLGIEPTLSYGYTGSVRDGEWGVQLSTLEALVYPLHANLYEAFNALESGGAEALLSLQPSSEYRPVVHDRRKLLRVIQEIMEERTGSRRCRSLMVKALGCDTTYLAGDFRNKGKTISMHKVEMYCLAAGGISLGDVFRRYYEKYSDDPENLNWDAYPAPAV